MSKFRSGDGNGSARPLNHSKLAASRHRSKDLAMSADRIPDHDDVHAVRTARSVVARAFGEPTKQPLVRSFFDEATNTASHVGRDPASRHCAVIDSVLDYDAASGRTATESADQLIAFIREQRLQVEWILETHVHADHLSAAPYLKKGSAAHSESARTSVSSKTSSAKSSMPGPNSSATAASSTSCSQTASASRSANSTRSRYTHQATRRTR